MRPVEAFEQQSVACAALGSPMYAELLARLAEDVAANGPTATVIEGHEDDPGPSALALRLLGSVHRLVLERRAGELATYFPSVGGTWEPEAGAEAFLRLLVEQADAVREWLDRPPQTNEVGRASALVGGLMHLSRKERQPVRLFEIGSSGGLNLLADRFAFVDDRGSVFGHPSSPVRLDPAWRGRALVPWPALEFVARLGCDPMPIDAATTEGGQALTAYVWPDQQLRLERLRGALDLARTMPQQVQRVGAADFVDRIDLVERTTTVLWHSVMWQYLSGAEQRRVDERIVDLSQRATERSPFVHLTLEPTRRTPDSDHEFLVVLTSWPGGRRRILGRAPPHGMPVTWEPAQPLDPQGHPCEGGGTGTGEQLTSNEEHNDGGPRRQRE